MNEGPQLLSPAKHREAGPRARARVEDHVHREPRPLGPLQQGVQLLVKGGGGNPRERQMPRKTAARKRNGLGRSPAPTRP